MAKVSYELRYTSQVDTVSEIKFSNKVLKGSELARDHDAENNKYKNSSINGVASNGQRIFIAVEASGSADGEIRLEASVSGKKTTIYPIISEGSNGNYSFSGNYQLES